LTELWGLRAKSATIVHLLCLHSYGHAKKYLRRTLGIFYYWRYQCDFRKEINSSFDRNFLVS
jgi:hypothetical protein